MFTGELKVHIEKTEGKVLVCSVENMETAIKVAEESPNLVAIFVLGMDEKKESMTKLAKPILSLDKYLNEKSLIGDITIPVKLNTPREKAIAYILPSSGTTGFPKGVIRTHLNSMAAVPESNADDKLFGTSEDTTTCHQPMPHASGGWTMLYSAVFAIRTVVYRAFDVGTFCSLVEKYKVTNAFLAPSHLTLLVKYDDLSKYDMSSLKQITTGGSPVPKYTLDVIFKKLNIDNLRQGYGSSEAGMISSAPFSLVMPSTAGSLTRSTCVKIVDPSTGQALGPKEQGEIYAKGPEISPGYINNEEAYKENFTADGWLKTGDAGYYNEDGLLFIVDRYKDVIKVDTQQVAPEEIESLLLKHRYVQEAAVIGIPDEIHGEIPKAFVVLKPQFKNIASATSEIKESVDHQVGEWKKLRGGVHLLPKLPLVSLGKIDKKSLRLL